MRKFSNATSLNRVKAPRRRYIRRILCVLIFFVAIYIMTLTPSHDGEWSPLQARLPEVETLTSESGTSYRITNIRDFRYNDDGNVRDASYRGATYHLDDLRQVWFGISHFGNYGLAHTFLSFEFAEHHFLAVSIEARLRSGQGYNPLKGLMRQYTKLIVLGTEADIIGLRTHIRAERVLLYPLQLTEPQRHYLFDAMMSDVKDILGQPDFYNTLFDNCATNLLKHDPEYRFYASLFDYRLLLPGYSDAVIQEKGWISVDVPLERLRETALINSSLMNPDTKDFSQLIRQGWGSRSVITSSE